MSFRLHPFVQQPSINHSVHCFLQSHFLLSVDTCIHLKFRPYISEVIFLSVHLLLSASYFPSRVVFISVNFFIHPSSGIHPSLPSNPSTHPFSHSSIHPFIHQSIHPPMHPSTHNFHPPTDPSFPFTDPSLPPIHPSLSLIHRFHPPIYPSTHPIYPPIHFVLWVIGGHRLVHSQMNCYLINSQLSSCNRIAAHWLLEIAESPDLFIRSASHLDATSIFSGRRSTSGPFRLRYFFQIT